MTVATATVQQGRQLHALEVLGEILLGWGALSAVLYAGGDVLAALRYEGYGYASQTISELSAIGAPTRPLVVALSLAYDVLAIGFGLAVWEAARGKRAVRVTGALLIAYGALGLVAPLVPMHVRGAPTSLTDALHVALTAVTVTLILLQLAFGSAAAGRSFRLYSLGTLLVVLVFGAVTGSQGPRVAAGDPTPWIGITERICVGAYLLWVAVLDVVLLRAETREAAALVPRPR